MIMVIAMMMRRGRSRRGRRRGGVEGEQKEEEEEEALFNIRQPISGRGFHWRSFPKARTYKSPRGLDPLLGHLPGRHKLGLCLTAM